MRPARLVERIPVIPTIERLQAFGAAAGSVSTAQDDRNATLPRPSSGIDVDHAAEHRRRLLSYEAASPAERLAMRDPLTTAERTRADADALITEPSGGRSPLLEAAEKRSEPATDAGLSTHVGHGDLRRENDIHSKL
ncbi:MAG: hypothetical protein ACR2F6_13870 [Mycobacteriales bacterium]